MSLVALCQEKGFTTEAVAVHCDVSPKLFDSVDAGRQPLPLAVARRVALVIGVELWAVVQAARKTTPQDGARFRNPVPPRALKYLAELQPTAAPVAETAPLAAALATFTLST